MYLLRSILPNNYKKVNSIVLSTTEAGGLFASGLEITAPKGWGSTHARYEPREQESRNNCPKGLGLYLRESATSGRQPQCLEITAPKGWGSTYEKADREYYYQCLEITAPKGWGSTIILKSA